MIGEVDEEYFPRGGKSKNVMKKNSFVFGPKKGNKEPMKKPGKRERTKNRQLKKGNRSVNEDDEDDDEESYDDSNFNKIAKLDGEDVSSERRGRTKKVHMLSYQNIVEGMVVLCTMNSESQHTENRVQVCLPERLLCSVNADDVVLTKSLGVALEGPSKKRERHPPKPGSFVVCKIKSCSRKCGDFEVVGTTNPAHIYSSTLFSDIHVGSVFLGAVKDTEDYGFLVYSGIGGLIAFLPYENCVDPEKAKKQFFVGKLIWCIVVHSKLGDTTNAVRVSMKPEDFESHRISESVLTPQSVLPGMELDLTVTKHLGGDLEVTVDGTQVYGFVPRSHFPTLADEASRFKIGSKLRGTVLYKYPISNIVAFSLRVNRQHASKSKVGNGTVFKQAEIVSHDKRGLGVRFDHNGDVCYGIVSKRKMEGTIESDKLEEMFPKGNHLSVVVIGYHHIDQLYSCSTQNDLLTGKVMVASKKKEMAGKLVTVMVKEKTASGLKVTWGDTNATVPPSHISDVVGAKHILKSLPINSSQKGRVFQFNPQKNSFIVTLRPTLVNNKPLVDFSKVVKGDEYWGVVNSVNESSINVLFFNNLKTNIDYENLVQDCHKYRIGELVKCFVIKDNQQNQTPVFSLLRPVDQMLLSVGATYKLIVKAKDENGISCLLVERKNVINVSIPLHHLSDFESLRKKTLEKLTPGATLDAVLFCFDRHLQPVFTLRESVKQYFKAGGPRLLQKGYAALMAGDVMPVILSEETDEGYYVSVPVPMFNRKILVEKEMVKRCGNFTVGDVIWLAVNRRPFESGPPRANFDLVYPDTEMFRKRLLKWAVSNLVAYLNESALVQTYKMGQKVSAVGTGVKNQCKLSDGRIGLIATGKRENPVKYPAGQSVDFLFIQEDSSSMREGCVHLLRPGNRETESKESQLDDNAGRHKPFKVVFTSEMFYVGQSTTGEYCVCPRFLQPNSLQPDLRAKVVDGDEIIKIEESLPYEGGLTIGCPLLNISKKRNISGVGELDVAQPKMKKAKKKELDVAQPKMKKAKKKKKKRSIGSASGNIGGSNEKAKCTFVTSSNSVKSPRTGKFGDKKKGKSKKSL